MNDLHGCSLNHCLGREVFTTSEVEARCGFIEFQGQGLGRALLEDCIMRSVNLSDFIGIRALVTHPIDETAHKFYFKMGFDESPAESNQLMILLKDARQRLSNS